MVCTSLLNEMVSPKLLLLLLPLADIFLTYQVLVRAKISKKDYYVLEANPLARNLIRKLGLNKALTIMGGFAVFFGALIVLFSSTNSLYFYGGMYFMVVYHNSYSLYRTIKTLKSTKKVK